MEGCTNMQVYRLIIMPIAKPMLAIIALWSFIGPFMDFLLPKSSINKSEALYIRLTGLFTLIVDERTKLEPVFLDWRIVNINTNSNIIYFLTKKQLVSGLSSGSVKG